MSAPDLPLHGWTPERRARLPAHRHDRAGGSGNRVPGQCKLDQPRRTGETGGGAGTRIAARVASLSLNSVNLINLHPVTV